MDKIKILEHTEKALGELENIPEFTEVDFTGEADDLIRFAYNNLDEAIIRLHDLIKYDGEVQSETD